MDNIVEIKGSVLIIPHRKWYHLFKFGWYRHKTISGKSWIRFNWPKDLTTPTTED